MGGARAPGMTPKKTFYSQKSSLNRPMRLKGLHHIQRTAGRIAASLGQKRRDNISINQDKCLKDFGSNIHPSFFHTTSPKTLRCFLNTQAIVFSTSVKGSVKLPGRATVT